MRWRDSLKVDYVALQTSCYMKCCSESYNDSKHAFGRTVFCIGSETQQVPPKSQVTNCIFVTEEAEFEIYKSKSTWNIVHLYLSKALAYNERLYNIYTNGTFLDWNCLNNAFMVVLLFENVSLSCHSTSVHYTKDFIRLIPALSDLDVFMFMMCLCCIVLFFKFNACHLI